MNSFLTLLTPDNIRHRRGFGDRVMWINRGITDPDDFTSHQRLLISGPAHIGKTREALELIYRAVKSGMVAEDRVVELSPEARISDPHFLRRELSRQVDPAKPLLLFLDDLPAQYGDADRLSNLEIALQALDEAGALYVIATARSQQVTAIVKEWLDAQGFSEQAVRGLTEDETARLIAGAVGATGIHTDYDVSEKLIAANDGTPERTLLTYLQVAEEGLDEIDGQSAGQFQNADVRELWAGIRQSLLQRDAD
ncbi:MAG: hypothetical protein ACK2UR_12625, partial [Candidatus Promineifilaceae bacterium]